MLTAAECERLPEYAGAGIPHHWIIDLDLDALTRPIAP